MTNDDLIQQATAGEISYAKSDRQAANALAEPPQLAPGASGGVSPEASRTPSEWAQLAADHWRQSTTALLDCACVVDAAWKAFKNNKSAMTAFLDGLVNRGMITLREAADPEASAKLSYLRKLAVHAEFLKRAEVTQRLGASYTKLERAVALREKLRTYVADADGELVKILEECPNETIDRAYLIKQIKSLPSRFISDKQSGSSRSDKTAEQLPATTTWTELLHTKRHFDRVLITLSSQTARRIERAASQEAIEEALPIRKVIGEKTAIVIAAALSDLPVVVRSLADQIGGIGKPRVLLAQRPETPCCEKADVLIVYQGKELTPNIDRLWENDEKASAQDRALRLFGPGDWLHVFAARETKGWTTLVRDAGWLDLPGSHK